MARPLGYTPPTPADSTAGHDVDDLVLALAESGLLRALAGAARSYPQLLHHVTGVTDPDVLRSLVLLARAFEDPDPDRTERLATGVRRARVAVADAASGPPEGPRRLLARLLDPDTRRGLSAVLSALAAVGGALGEADGDDPGRGRGHTGERRSRRLRRRSRG